MKFLLLVACALDYSICKHDDETINLQKEATTRPPPPPIGPFAPGGNPLAFTAKPLEVLEQTFTPSIPEQFLQTKASTQHGASTRSFSFLDTTGSKSGKPSTFQITVQHPTQRPSVLSILEENTQKKNVQNSPQNQSVFNQASLPAADPPSFNEAKQREHISNSPAEVGLINDRPVILTDQQRSELPHKHLEREDEEEPTIHTLTDVSVQSPNNAKQQQGIFFVPPLKPKGETTSSLSLSEIDFINSIRPPPSSIVTPTDFTKSPEALTFNNEDIQQRSVNPDTQNIIPVKSSSNRSGKSTGLFQDVDTGEVLPQQNKRFIQGITGEENIRIPDHDERMSRVEADFQTGKRQVERERETPPVRQSEVSQPSFDQQTFQEQFRREKEALERKFSAKEFDPSVLAVTEFPIEQQPQITGRVSQGQPNDGNFQNTKEQSGEREGFTRVKTIDFTIKNTHHAGGVTTQTFRQVIPLRNQRTSQAEAQFNNPANEPIAKNLPIQASLVSNPPPAIIPQPPKARNPQPPPATISEPIASLPPVPEFRPQPLKTFNREQLEEERKYQEEQRLFEEDQRRYREQQRKFDEDQRRFQENRRRFQDDQRRFEEQKRKYEMEKQRFEDEKLRNQPQPSRTEAPENVQPPRRRQQIPQSLPQPTQVPVIETVVETVDLKNPPSFTFSEQLPPDSVPVERIPEEIQVAKKKKPKRLNTENRHFTIDHRAPISSHEKVNKEVVEVQVRIPPSSDGKEAPREQSISNQDPFYPVNFDVATQAPRTNPLRQRTPTANGGGQRAQRGPVQKTLKFTQGTVYSENNQRNNGNPQLTQRLPPRNVSFELAEPVREFVDIPPPARSNKDDFKSGKQATKENQDGSGDLPGTPGLDYPIYANVPDTAFNCKKQESAGMYADIETGCQAFHNCDPLGHKMSFLCPNGTIFKQELFICDWWYNVQCSDSDKFFNLNTNKYTTPRPRRRRRRNHEGQKRSA